MMVFKMEVKSAIAKVGFFAKTFIPHRGGIFVLVSDFRVVDFLFFLFSLVISSKKFCTDSRRSILKLLVCP